MHTETIILTKSPTTIFHIQLKKMTLGFPFSDILYTQGCVKQAS